MLELTLNKLHSRKGASLTFALLAFLVCAVISAVLLAAAQTAAGRVSGLADADQRYYAVSSAAQLFCDAVGKESQPFRIEWTKKEEKEKYKITVTKEDGVPVESAPDSSLPKSITYDFEFQQGMKDAINTNPLKIDTLGILAKAAVFYAFGGTLEDYTFGEEKTMEDFVEDAFVKDKGTYVIDTARAVACPKVWNMQISATNTEYSGLTVDVVMTMNAQGDITVLFKNHRETSDDDQDVYCIQVDLAVSGNDISENVSTNTVMERNTAGTDTYEETFTTTETTTRKLSISWSVGNVTKSTEVG